MSRHTVTVTTVAPLLTAVVAQTTTWEQFPGLWPQLLDEVYSVVRNQPHLGSTPGPPWQNVMLYKDDAPSVEIGVLAAAPVAAQGRVVASALPAGKTVMTTHRGDYAGLGRAHAAVHRFAELEHLVLQGPRWEIYGHHDDRREPETQVYYLLS